MLLSEHQVEWVDRCIAHSGLEEGASVEPRPESEEEWMVHMNEVGKDSLLHKANSWYMGANIPGKPRALLSYLGGLENYRQQTEAGESDNYRKLVVSKVA